MLGARALALAAVVAGCGRQDAPPRATAPAPDASAPGAVDAAPLDAGAATGGDASSSSAALAWPEAIRAGRFAEAAEGLSRLPAEEQRKPEVRLAQARVSIALGKPAEARVALEKLDDELPLLRELIVGMRARVELAAGPHDKAAEHFGARRDVASWILAAEAWDKAADNTKARAAWDRVANAPGRTRAQEEKARFRRMQITRLKDGDAAALADATWLATHALDDAVFSEAAEVLEKQSPPKHLTADELFARARVLAEGSRTDEALRALERAGTRTTADGKSLPAIELCHAKAEIYYKARTRYPEAALAYRQCANMGGPRAAEDLFLSARAFSRADRDADAQPAFQSVIQHHPKTTYADQAEFHLARTHALAGRWKDAAFAFDEYARHWGTSGKERREAERYRALAHLMSRNDKKARKLLEDLSGAAEDPLTAARWTNLAALAALRDGDKLHALARWADVARTRPLSYPALVARARLAENGGTLPPAIEPAESGSATPIAVELPPPIDLLHRIGFDGEAEAMLREREPAIVAKAEARGTEALCAAYAMLDRGKRRYQIALQVPQRELATAPGGKNRGAWDCLFPRPHAGIVRAAALSSRIDGELVWSVMRQESAFDPDVVSPARAVGLMQLMPETARATAKAIGLVHDDAMLTSPSQSVTLGALYLRAMLDAFSDNVVLAVAAYNAGPEAIQRWLGHAKGETLDVFVEAIPFVETRGYVARVLGNLARYGYMERGEAGVPVLGLELK
ncbi:MAG: transglycosylase SLT domain-containing protein [Labilithrix sp.]|nr:transglycosylase SLT domain-containing protein [Labilithrix sp.]MBX3223410.1 transglycosylase SLT domain-containing protein [Labilithrix sp.]